MFQFFLMLKRLLPKAFLGKDHPHNYTKVNIKAGVVRARVRATIPGRIDALTSSLWRMAATAVTTWPVYYCT